MDRNLQAVAPAIYATRLAVVDNQIQEGELASLAHGAAGVVADRPPDAVREHADRVRSRFPSGSSSAPMPETLEIAYDAAYRQTPRHVYIHVPPLRGLSRVTVNGKPPIWNAPYAKETDRVERRACKGALRAPVGLLQALR